MRLATLTAVLVPSFLAGQAPDGLARAALANAAFTWVHHEAPHLRLHFLVDSYAAVRADRLIRSTQAARAHDLALLGVEDFAFAIDVFFIDTRAQMDSLVGVPATGFAHRDARAVFLVANADWRSFERHELMHVLAHHLWGPAAQPSAWIEEGLAQFADGRCGAHSVDSVAHALGADAGHVSLDTLVARFRELNDLGAYLQAASFVGYLYARYGRDTVRDVWQNGADALVRVTGQSLHALGDRWLSWAHDRARPVPAGDLAVIRRKGCG